MAESDPQKIEQRILDCEEALARLQGDTGSQAHIAEVKGLEHEIYRLRAQYARVTKNDADARKWDRDSKAAAEAATKAARAILADRLREMEGDVEQDRKVRKKMGKIRPKNDVH